MSVLASLLLSACGGQVSVPPPSPAPEVADLCQSLTDSLPDQVEDQPRRETDPPSPLTAAWGKAPIVLRCGVGRPAAFEPTSEVAVVNGVKWFPEEREDGYVFTTWGRIVNIEVTVPGDYEPEVNPLVDLGPAIKQTVPQVS